MCPRNKTRHLLKSQLQPFEIMLPLRIHMASHLLYNEYFFLYWNWPLKLFINEYTWCTYAYLALLQTFSIDINLIWIKSINPPYKMAICMVRYGYYTYTCSRTCFYYDYTLNYLFVAVFIIIITIFSSIRSISHSLTKPNGWSQNINAHHIHPYITYSAPASICLSGKWKLMMRKKRINHNNKD